MAKATVYVVGQLLLTREGSEQESPLFAIFSEKTPTASGIVIQWVHLEVTEDRYDAAKERAIEHMNSDHRFVKKSANVWKLASHEEFLRKTRAMIQAANEKAVG